MAYARALTERERTILTRRLRLLEKPDTCKAIGLDLGLSAARVREIEIEAVHKLAALRRLVREREKAGDGFPVSDRVRQDFRDFREALDDNDVMEASWRADEGDEAIDAFRMLSKSLVGILSERTGAWSVLSHHGETSRLVAELAKLLDSFGGPGRCRMCHTNAARARYRAHALRDWIEKQGVARGAGTAHADRTAPVGGSV
jgi:hypothetical protein